MEIEIWIRESKPVTRNTLQTTSRITQVARFVPSPTPAIPRPLPQPAELPTSVEVQPEQCITTPCNINNEITRVCFINTDELEENAQLIHRIAIPVHEYCLKYECHNSGYSIIQSKIRQVNKSIQKLKIILHKRTKLINTIDSIFKTLFGTLDNDNLDLINKNLDKLFNDQNKIDSIIQNQTIMIRQAFIDDNFKSLTARLVEQSTKLQETRNTLTFDEMLFTLEILYSEFADKIKFYNTIILGENGIIDTTFVNIDHFKRIKTIETPILEEHEWTIIKYYPIPLNCQIHNVFLAFLIDHDVILEKAGSQIIINEYYLKQYCKNSPLGLICERTQPTRHDYHNGCQVSKSNDHTQCGTTVFKIDTITFIPMYIPNRYIAIPQRPLEVQALCKRINRIHLIGPSILSSDEECVMLYDNNVMKIGGTNKEIQIHEAPYIPKFNISSINYKLLEQLIPHALYVTPNFNTKPHSTLCITNYNKLKPPNESRA
ncbi:hypothetical protein WN51_08997 [Melipona quadrifasciata]|uniref:Uncharacterized protein n=1 Tax=Melipona quadrifasciata TaxID=166423 RepID=A0A0M9ABV5_9HYME|nr:hypothetical protein WN51_08997 [Melipona quadrifasciata]